MSQTQRQAADEWYDHTLYSRLNVKLSGAIVLIMHRLHESLPSGVTRGTTSLATSWHREVGGGAPQATPDETEAYSVETVLRPQSF